MCIHTWHLLHGPSACRVLGPLYQARLDALHVTFTIVKELLKQDKTRNK